MKTLTQMLRVSRIAILSLLLVSGIFIAFSVPVFSGGAPRQSQQRYLQERYLEVTEVSGTVTYDYEPLKAAQARSVKVGDRLRRPGEGIDTGSGSTVKLMVDNGIGTLDVSENSNVRVKNLNRSGSGATSTDLALNRGQVRAKVRSFNNRQSRFSIQTPAGVAGVRGTEFVVTVLPNGETRVITIDGTVALSSTDRTQEVSAGYASAIVPGNPPTLPTAIAANLRVSLQLLPAPDSDKVRVTGVVNPIDSVFLNEEAVDVSPTGSFEVVVPLPSNGVLRLRVRNALGQEQVYELIAP
ncbi:FecR domain-containing protein [Aerosakkonema sp. BLCC-F2]